jgi:hypothetical protein
MPALTAVSKLSWFSREHTRLFFLFRQIKLMAPSVSLFSWSTLKGFPYTPGCFICVTWATGTLLADTTFVFKLLTPGVNLLTLWWDSHCVLVTEFLISPTG